MNKRIPFSMIKRKVNKLRIDCDIDINSIDMSDKANVATDLEKIAICRKINIISHSFSDDTSGVFYQKRGQLYLGVNELHPETRQRFTIAHEIGHHILHSDDILHRDDKEIDRVYFRSEVQSREETEANFFAAELLMPEVLIDKCIENGIEYVDDLAAYFKVSDDAMRYRLINLGYL